MVVVGCDEPRRHDLAREAALYAKPGVLQRHEFADHVVWKIQRRTSDKNRQNKKGLFRMDLENEKRNRGSDEGNRQVARQKWI